MRTCLALPAALAASLAGHAAPADVPVEVDVELFLAVDVSRSMTPRELEIQRRGYAEALVSDEVVAAVASGALKRIALTYVEWAGYGSQRVVVDWTMIEGRGDLEVVAGQLTADFSTALRRTSVSGALDFARESIARNDFTAVRQVIDVSGDGPNNDGRPVVPARDEAVAAGLIVNGLPLMTREGIGMQWHLENLDEYYRNCVIGGPGAFVIPVLDWEDFEQAVRMKLVLDLVSAPLPPEAEPAVTPVQTEGYDCLVGEKIWNRLQGDWR